ncbi:MAG: tetratricopeptide repeat protein [Gemmatimonadaceae bacterium]
MRGYEQVGDLDGARSVADIVLRVIPTSVRHHQKRVEYAVRSNDRVRLVEAYVELADSLFRSGEPEKARVVYSRVLELSPGNGRARFALGLLSEEEHARDAGSERARDASVPVSPEYVVGLFDRSVPVSSAPGAAPTQTISSEIPVVVEGLFVSPPAAVEPPLELESAAAPLASGEARAAQREEVASVEEIVSREIEHHAAQGSRADVADVADLADHADPAEDSPAADATTEPNDLLDGHAAAHDGVQVVGVEPVIEQGGTQDVEQGANASLDAAEGDDDVAPFPAPSLDDEIDAAFAEPPVVEPVTPPSSGVLPTGTDYDFVGTPPLGAAALATPFAADEGSNGDAGDRGREERPADRPYIGTPRSATPLPAASLGLVPPRPSALPRSPHDRSPPSSLPTGATMTSSTSGAGSARRPRCGPHAWSRRRRPPPATSKPTSTRCSDGSSRGWPRTSMRRITTPTMTWGSPTRKWG